MLLNSLWGRFGMKTNRTKSKIFTSTDQWFNFLSDSKNVILNNKRILKRKNRINFCL